jgi:Xaa-Pro aminopeptidase
MVSLSQLVFRRELLAEQMRQRTEHSAAILFAAPEVRRNRDVYYPYRQESDFYYLSGFDEPEAVMVLIPEQEGFTSILFCREKDPEKELWEGVRLGPQKARRALGFQKTYPIGDLEKIMPSLLEGKEGIYYAWAKEPHHDTQVLTWLSNLKKKVRAGVRSPNELFSLDYLLHEMRLFKSYDEIHTMRHAAEIAARAHFRAMKVTRPGLMEYQVEAEILHEFIALGASSPAYGSIVAGGSNACILHYRNNNQKLKDGDLLLIDAGAEYKGYASDITRTFPINGRFSPEQKAVYQLVLKAQKAAIKVVKPGVSWNKPHEKAVQVLTEGLVQLGLLKGNPKELIKKGAYRRFYMHRTGHWLGMDVHDVGEYKIEGEWRALEPNMVFTVEPGLYVSPTDTTVAAKWRGIGIRIEDDVLVTQSGSEVLSVVPKEVDEIEAVMASG